MSHHSAMAARFVELYEADSPAEVFAVAWKIAEVEVGADAAGLWQRDTDSQMFVRAQWNFSRELARARLPKMDSGIGQVVMETGETQFVPDIAQVPNVHLQYPALRAFERKLLADMRVRAIIIVPTDEDFALTLMFNKPPQFTAEDVHAQEDLARHLVRAVGRAHTRVVDATLVELGELLSASPEISHETMDRVAELTRSMVSAGGVSVFLVQPGQNRLMLAGTTGLQGVTGPDAYESVTYKVKRGYGLTSDVFIDGRPFRWPDLGDTGSAEALDARGFVWKHRWSELRASHVDVTLAIMLNPLPYTYTDPKDGTSREQAVGIIRASGRQQPETHFSPGEQEALRRVATMLGQHVWAVRRAAAESLDVMQRIAHQFVSPLNALLWQVERLRSPRLAKDQRAHVTAAVHHLALIAALYGKNFELISRLFSGDEDVLQLRVERLGRAVIPVVRNYQAMALHSNIVVHVAVGEEVGSVDEMVVVRMDILAFRQALINVLDNGLKYGHRHSRIDLTARFDADGQVALDVVGLSRIPVASEDLPCICRKGWRSRGARSLHVAGTGTGLWLAREIMRRHGGDLLVRPSEPTDGGHRVMFTLKLEAVEEATSAMLRAVRKRRVRRGTSATGGGR